MDGFQFKDNELLFFPIPIAIGKDYVSFAQIPELQEVNKLSYVYDYTDHASTMLSTGLGNIRLSYTSDPGLGLVKKVEENHYYPFGLEHGIYNGSKKDYKPTGDNREILSLSNVPYKYKYQGQERQDELDLNWDSFKWRNYDYAIGRFMSVDPLAEDYNYQSPYNFAENRVVDGNELEGLEWENFMSGFSKPKDLKVQSPSANAQKQSYNITTLNNSKSVSEMHTSFKSNSGSLLNNSSASFKQINGDGNKVKNGSISEGSFIKIGIDGPFNNSIVKVIGAESSENGFSYTFGTLEGHVEKGVITFSVSTNDDGSTTFSINSSSESNNGTINFLGAEDAVRNPQMNS